MPKAVTTRRFRKEKKGAIRLDDFEAHTAQFTNQQIPLGLIFGNIYRFILQPGHQSLHQRRSVDETEHPVTEDRSLHELPGGCHAGIGREIPDPLTRQSEVLAV